MNERLREELDYCVPLGIPHSVFLSWEEDDQDKALAYQREMAKVCSGCGTRQVEWDEDPDAYIGWVRRCEGCSRLNRERLNLGDEHDPSAHIGLLPRHVAVARMAAGDEGI